MKLFMDKDFMLSTESAQKLFHQYAESMPILDYHCHINPREIAEDRKFDNITQVWLGGDRCVPTAWMRNILPVIPQTGRNSRNGQRL